MKEYFVLENGIPITEDTAEPKLFTGKEAVNMVRELNFGTIAKKTSIEEALGIEDIQELIDDFEHDMENLNVDYKYTVERFVKVFKYHGRYDLISIIDDTTYSGIYENIEENLEEIKKVLKIY